MKNLLILSVALLTLVSCGNRNKNKVADNAAVDNTNMVTTVQMADESTIYVYYFHGKQRCKTCVAVEEVARKTIDDVYSGNPEVRFMEIKNDEAESTPLVEKYEVTWNALIIAKGNNHIEITKQAFANAVNKPEVLTELIKTEVNKRLTE